MINEKVLDDGLRLGDRCLIHPAMGKRKEIVLNRKEIEIVCDGDNVRWDYHRLYLPRLTNETARWKLVLHEDKRESRYQLVSYDREFYHHGVPILNGWPLRNCRLKFDYNYLTFQKPGTIVESDSIGIEKAIIRSHLPILLQGETGTGKSTLARRLHEESGRMGKFVHLSLKSFNGQLLESELFGHVKGAFTGAIREKRGAVAEAHLGTLFLDEIDSIDQGMQAKLLLLLDHFKYRMVGGDREMSSDIRLIVASSKPLSQLVEQGLFRQDLYYRIASGKTMMIKSLRQDRKKLAGFIDDFLQKHYLSIDSSLKKYYLEYSWPGNIRQLLSHLEQKKILSSNGNLTIGEEDKILESVAGFSQTINYEGILPMNDLKLKYAKWALAFLNGNISSTARKLGISKNTLKRILDSEASLPQSYGY